MIYNIKARAVPAWIVQFSKLFLQDQTTRLSLGGYIARVIKIDIGILQGSALSPILFLFFACTLLLELQDGTTSAFRFVNNSNIITYSRTIEENCRALEQAHEVCMRWARCHGAVFALEKYHLMHLTRSYSRFNMAATVNIIGFREGPVANLQVLGVQVDSKLK
jgi:hypothetical protein